MVSRALGVVLRQQQDQQMPCQQIQAMLERLQRLEEGIGHTMKQVEDGMGSS